jgi:hypothetical protein
MKKITILLIGLISTSAYTYAQKEYKLHYSFKKGDTYEWSQSEVIKQHILVAGNEQNTETTIKANALLKVIELVPNGARFEIEYTKVFSNVPQAGLTLDSEGDTTKNIGNKVLQAMKGKKFNFTLTKTGTIESVENIENLWSGLTPANGFKVAETAPMKATLENQFGKASVTNTLEASLVSYPENKVKVGIAWNTKKTIANPLPLGTDYVWTLESVQEPNGVIVADGKSASTDTTKIITLQQGLKATTNFKGRKVFKVNVNLSTGWPETTKAYSEQKGTMMLQPGGQIPEEMPLALDLSIDSEYTIKKK